MCTKTAHSLPSYNSQLKIPILNFFINWLMHGQISSVKGSGGRLTCPNIMSVKTLCLVRYIYVILFSNLFISVQSVNAMSIFFKQDLNQPNLFLNILKCHANKLVLVQSTPFRITTRCQHVKSANQVSINSTIIIEISLKFFKNLHGTLYVLCCQFLI
jgi:hypothetical protein